MYGGITDGTVLKKTFYLTHQNSTSSKHCRWTNLSQFWTNFLVRSTKAHHTHAVCYSKSTPRYTHNKYVYICPRKSRCQDHYGSSTGDNQILQATQKPVYIHVKIKVAQSCPTLCISMDIQSVEFSRPEYWSGQPFPSPRDLPNPGIEPRSPALQVDSLAAEAPEKPINCGILIL